MGNRMRIGASGRRPGRRGLGTGVLIPFFVLLLGLLGAPRNASAENWGFAWEIGAITATPKGDPFVFRLTAARVYSEEFSFGPSLYLTPYGDNAMYSGSLNAAFHVALEDFHLSPFFGVGVAHRTTEDDDDTALLIPMGMSLDRPIGEKLYLVGTFSVNLHNGMELEGEDDGVSIGLTAGISYRP